MSSNNPYITRGGASILKKMSARVKSVVNSSAWEKANRKVREKMMTRLIDAFRRSYMTDGGNIKLFDMSNVLKDAKDHIIWDVNVCSSSAIYSGCTCMKAEYVQMCQNTHCMSKIYIGDCIVIDVGGWRHVDCPLPIDYCFEKYCSATDNECTKNGSTSSKEVDEQRGVATDQDEFTANKQKDINLSSEDGVERELASRDSTSSKSKDVMNDSDLCRRSSNMGGSLISPNSVSVIDHSGVGGKDSAPSNGNIFGTSSCAASRTLFVDERRMSKEHV